jgi:hypothetical protein
MATCRQRFGVHFLLIQDEVQYCILKDSGAGLLYCKRLKVEIEDQNVSFEDSPSLLTPSPSFPSLSRFTCCAVSMSLF